MPAALAAGPLLTLCHVLCCPLPLPLLHRSARPTPCRHTSTGSARNRAPARHPCPSTPCSLPPAAPPSSLCPPPPLQAYYYQQHLQQGPDQASLPDNAMCAAACSLSALGLIGHLSSVLAAEAAFRSHFPGVSWLSEIDPDAGAGVDPDDEDGDAIDALQAALGNLSSSQAASAS